MTTQRSDRLLPRWLLIATIAVLSFFIVSIVLFTYVYTAVDPMMGYTQFLAEVQEGRVTRVEQEGETLTVFEGAERSQVVVPAVVTDVYGEMQAAADKGGHPLPAGVYSAVSAPDRSWLGFFVTALAPLALVIIVFAFGVYILGRRQGEPPDVASRLRALDQAWKAGLITDDERDRKRTEIIEGI